MLSRRTDTPVSYIDPANFKRILAGAILVPLCLPLGLAALFLWQMSRQVSASRRVDHSDRAIARAYDTQKLMIDAETGLRGYLLSGSKEFLEPYDRATQQLPNAQNEMSQMFMDSSGQLIRVNSIRSLYTRWETWARDNIQGSSAPDSHSVTNDLAGKELMDALREQFANLIRTEESLRDSQVANFYTANWTTTASVGFFAIFVGILLAAYSRRQLLRVSGSYGAALGSESRQREYLRVALSSIGDAVIATDDEQSVTFVNPVAASLTGWSTEEALGKRISDIFKIANESTGETVESPVSRGLAEGVATGLANHTVLITKDGSRVAIDDSAAPIRDAEGKVAGAILVFRDVTKARRAEAERAQLLEREQTARTEAEAANRLKDEFLATLSHELRTPLTAVLGWARLLRSNDYDGKTADRALEAIERNARAQAFLIEDLLDISRIVRGNLLIEPRPVELKSVISAAIDSVRPTAEAKHIQVRTHIASPGSIVIGDPNRLQQVIWNILSNAIKFTPDEGSVEVDLKKLSTQMEIQVRDSGEGIDPQFLPHIFERFSQSSTGGAKKQVGLGLGLAIARHLVEQHGGTIKAANRTDGPGAVFTIRLPLAAELRGAMPVMESNQSATAPPLGLRLPDAIPKG